MVGKNTNEDKIRFDTAGSERMIINEVGHVGIGTSSPSTALTLDSSLPTTISVDTADGADDGYLGLSPANATGTHRSGNISIYGNEFGVAGYKGRVTITSGGAYTSGLDGAISFRTGDAGVGTHTPIERMAILNNGDIGIGTKTPATAMEIKNNAAQITLSDADATKDVAGHHAAVILADSAGSTTGFLGFGTSSQVMSIQNRNATGDIRFTAGGTSTRMTIASGGNVGIGTSGPTHLFHVNGVARSTSANFATSSDRRVKENIVEVEDGLEKILTLRPVRYNYIEKFVESQPSLGGTKTGFIAQEVAAIDSTMVNYVEEKFGDEVISDFNILSTDNMIPLLVAATQEQQKLIEANLKMFKTMQGTLERNTRDIASLKIENEKLKVKVESQEKRLNSQEEKIQALQKKIELIMKKL